MKRFVCGLLGIIVFASAALFYSAKAIDTGKPVEPPVLYYKLAFNDIAQPRGSERGWALNFLNESEYAIVDYIAVAKYRDDGKIVRLYCYDYIEPGEKGKAATIPDDANGAGVNMAEGKGGLDIKEISYTVDMPDKGWVLVVYDFDTEKYSVEEIEKRWSRVRAE